MLIVIDQTNKLTLESKLILLQIIVLSHRASSEPAHLELGQITAYCSMLPGLDLIHHTQFQLKLVLIHFNAALELLQPDSPMVVSSLVLITLIIMITLIDTLLVSHSTVSSSEMVTGKAAMSISPPLAQP